MFENDGADSPLRLRLDVGRNNSIEEARMAKHIQVTRETDSGRNTQFFDPDLRRSMTRPEFVREINHGNYPDYHTRNIGGVPTPVSNPDKRKTNNLG